MQAQLDKNGEIEVVKMMSLGAPGFFSDTSVRQVFVTKEFVIVRLKNQKN